MSLDLPIGRGDTEPAPTWAFDFDVTGSDFELAVTSRGVAKVHSVSGGELALDPVARTVAWVVTAAQSAALPDASPYTLRLIGATGGRRFVAEGRILAEDGPVGASRATVHVPGIQGPPGATGPAGASAYDLAGGDAAWGSLAAWQASLRAGASPVLTFQIRGRSSFTASHSLPYQPRAWLVDADGDAVDTDTLYAPGQVTVVFPSPFTGTLQLG